MKPWSRPLLLALVGGLAGVDVASGSSEAATVASTKMYASQGEIYTCSATVMSKLYRCSSPKGNVIYVTGDTENGCRNHTVGDQLADTSEFRRTVPTVCYADASADTALIAAMDTSGFTGTLDDLLTGITAHAALAGWSDQLLTDSLSDATAEWYNLEAQSAADGWNEQEWAEHALVLARYYGASADTLHVVEPYQVSCDDGLGAETEDWADILRSL